MKRLGDAMTFMEARTNLIGYLGSIGWTTNLRSVQGVLLKTPYATSPDGQIRVWFKPQALWMSTGSNHEIGNARSTWIDVRMLAPVDVVQRIRAVHIV